MCGVGVAVIHVQEGGGVHKTYLDFLGVGLVARGQHHDEEDDAQVQVARLAVQHVDDDGQQRRHDEQDHEEVGELHREQQPPRGARRRRQRVGAELLQQLGRLHGLQTAAVLGVLQVDLGLVQVRELVEGHEVLLVVDAVRRGVLLPVAPLLPLRLPPVRLGRVPPHPRGPPVDVVAAQVGAFGRVVLGEDMRDRGRGTLPVQVVHHLRRRRHRPVRRRTQQHLALLLRRIVATVVARRALLVVVAATQRRTQQPLRLARRPRQIRRKRRSASSHRVFVPYSIRKRPRLP